MPEGLSLVILREETARFEGQEIISAHGNTWCATRCSTRLYAGVGNIIKNEVLFRIRVHPLSTIGGLSPAKLRELVA